MPEFEWDETKVSSNLRKHGIAFSEAPPVFDDLWAAVSIDRSMDYGEERMIAIGMVGNVLLTVVYAERGERIRLISARRATKNERKLYERERFSQ